MQPQNTEEYKKLLTEVIKKQIVILGPDITLAKARNVAGLEVADDGTILNITGNPQEIVQKLIDQFVQLSGLIVKKTMEPLLMVNTPIQVPVAQTVVTPIVSPQPTPPTYPLTGNANPQPQTEIPVTPTAAVDNTKAK